MQKIKLIAKNVMPIHLACEKIDDNKILFDVLDMLLDAGSYINCAAKSKGYATPLTIACAKRDKELIARLIEKGADINFKLVRDGNRRFNWRIPTPLEVVCDNGDLDTFKFLIKNGAEYHKFIDKKCNNERVKSLTHRAYNERDIFVLQLFSNYNPLCILAMICLKNDLEMLKQISIRPHDSDGDVLLKIACKNKNLEMVKYIVESWAENIRYTGVLSIVYGSRCWEIFSFLLDSGASPNEMHGEWHILTDACIKGDMETVKRLIAAGADLNVRDETWTPLKKACRANNFELVKLLVASGADPNFNAGNWPPIKCTNDPRIIDYLKNFHREK